MAQLPQTVYPPHPAHLDPYIEVLGARMTVQFLLEFGGTPSLYFPNDPRGKSAIEAMIGPEALRALGQRLPSQRANVPVARTWMIHALTAEGRRRAEVCRLLRCSAETVRRSLKLPPNGASHPAETDDARPQPQQLKLF